MSSYNYNIKPYAESDREQVLSVWEKSVRATHDFLTTSDFEEIKTLVATINFMDLDVYCLKQGNEVAGFIGVAESKIEMLFLSPEHIGKGMGQKLLNFAIQEIKADKVDVNEGNRKAVDFYLKFGFEVYERTEKDDQGKNYPLLRMKLRS